MAFKQLNAAMEAGDKFKFEKVGDQITGHYMGSTELDINGKAVTRHTFNTAEGIKSTLGSFALNEGMAKVAPGTMTRVTYTETKKLKGGKTLKVFGIEVDTEQNLPIMAESAAAAHAANIAQAKTDPKAVAAELKQRAFR